VTSPWRTRPTASLFAQLLALIGIALVAAQAITVFLIFNLPPPVPDFYRLNEVVQALHGAPPAVGERRPLVVRTLTEPPKRQLDSRLAPAIRKALAEDLGVGIERVVIGSDASTFADRRTFRILRDRMAQHGDREEHFLVAPFEVAVRQGDGRWLAVRPDPGLALSAWQQRVVLWFLLSTLAMAPVAYLFARRLSAPIRIFADAAERIGRDPGAPPLVLQGSAEIDTAVRAFNEMQERLRRYVVYHTGMVGAVAHDLRTPLTRLRFRAESAPDDVRVKMAADIDQMEAMISATLTFVRDASRPSERATLELSSLLESLCDEMAETGQRTEVARAEKVVLEGDPIALRRMFTNLLENAVKFGGAARTRIYREDASAVVEIDDDGPGIPTQDAERVFEPFYRREPSRNRETGGIGLGLAVVRSVARGHGGDVALINRQGGGLTARVLLPI
jgi:two-component system OmpR family sensor kinase